MRTRRRQTVDAAQSMSLSHFKMATVRPGGLTLTLPVSLKRQFPHHLMLTKQTEIH